MFVLCAVESGNWIVRIDVTGFVCGNRAKYLYRDPIEGYFLILCLGYRYTTSQFDGSLRVLPTVGIVRYCCEVSLL